MLAQPGPGISTVPPTSRSWCHANTRPSPCARPAVYSNHAHGCIRTTKISTNDPGGQASAGVGRGGMHAGRRIAMVVVVGSHQYLVWEGSLVFHRRSRPVEAFRCQQKQCLQPAAADKSDGYRWMVRIKSMREKSIENRHNIYKARMTRDH